MEEYEKNMIPHIEAIYQTFTPLEKNIADFFIHNQETDADLSAKSIAKRLFVSEASLSRFAKKCGYSGYREFMFYYGQGESTAGRPPAGSHVKKVLNDYQELLNKSYSLIDEKQLDRIAERISVAERVYVYGKGSSGLAAREMKLRFMRIGVNIEAVTDADVMKMNAVLVGEGCVLVGVSVSGRSETVLEALRAGKKRGAATILITSHMNGSFGKFCDEVMLCAVKEHLEKGKAISPQFPVLVMMDMLYSRMLRMDAFHREALHEYTLEALDEKTKEERDI